jgi:hypothetical protein
VLAAGVLAATAAGFAIGFIRFDSGDPDGMLAIAYLVAGLMVIGTVGFGLSIVALRCPLCGHHLGASALRRSVASTITALLRPFTCTECGFDERRER